jgi:hypothetical protein
MRPGSVGFLLACVVIGACSRSENVLTPPRIPDRFGELKTFDPTSPDGRPNPSVDPSTLGCYSVTIDPRFEQLSPPNEFTLTGEPAGRSDSISYTRLN